MLLEMHIYYRFTQLIVMKINAVVYLAGIDCKFKYMNKMAADPSVYPKLSSSSMGDYEGRLSYFGDYHTSANRHRSAPL